MAMKPRTIQYSTYATYNPYFHCTVDEDMFCKYSLGNTSIKVRLNG